MCTADFEAAYKFVGANTSMKATDEEKLCFYKYYKQATIGDCNTPRPGMFQLQQKYKWDAWNSVAGMSKEDAMKAYVELLDKLAPNWRS